MPNQTLADLMRQVGLTPAWAEQAEARPGYAPPRPRPRSMRPAYVRAHDPQPSVRSQALGDMQREQGQRNQLAQLAVTREAWAPHPTAEQMLEPTGAPSLARGIRHLGEGNPGEALPELARGGFQAASLAALPYGGWPQGNVARAAPPLTRIYRGINAEYDPRRAAMLGDRWWHTNPEVASTYAPGSNGAHVIPGLIDESALNLAHVEAPPGTMWRAIPVESLPSRIRREIPRSTTHITSQEASSLAEGLGYDGVTFSGMRDSGFADAIDGPYPGFQTGDDGRVIAIFNDRVIGSPFPQPATSAATHYGEPPRPRPLSMFRPKPPQGGFFMPGAK